MTHQTNHSNLFNPIQKITIENFQSHSFSQIVPAGPGQLTVIVGQSRQGKTAIFRALRWLFYNAPDGDDFIRWGCTFARVTAEYADGTEVIRYRTSGGTNRYIIRKPGQQEQVYEGFGRGVVPLEVQQITGVSPVEIGEGLTLNINLAEQLDGPFLGNKAVSSTGRAKVLGKLAGTEEVDLAAKQLGTDLYRWRQDEKRLENEVVLLNEQLAGFEWLEPFKETIKELSMIRDKIKNLSERRDNLAKLSSEIKAVKASLAETASKLVSLNNIIHLSQVQIDFAEGAGERLKRLYALENEIIQNAASLEAAQATINKTEGLLYSDVVLRTAEGQVERQRQAGKINVQWNAIMDAWKYAEMILGETEGIAQAEITVQTMENQVLKQDQSIKLYVQFLENAAKMTNANTILGATKGVLEAESSLENLYAKMDRKNKLIMALDKWIRTNENMTVIERQIKRTKGIGEAEAIINKTQENYSNQKRLTELGSVLKGITLKIKAETVSAENGEYEIKTLQEEYFNTLKRAGKCPLCGTDGKEISQEKIKEII